MFPEKLRKALESGENLDKAIEEAAAPMRKVLTMLLNRRPFEPFRIHMTSRWQHEVRDPDEVVVGSGTATIRQRDEAGAWQRHCILALIHIVSLETLGVDASIVVDAPRGRSE